MNKILLSKWLYNLIDKHLISILIMNWLLTMLYVSLLIVSKYEYNLIKLNDRNNTFDLRIEKKDNEIERLNIKLNKELSKNKKLQEIIKTQKEKHRQFETLLKDLERCTNKNITFGIAFSESRLKYNIIHPSNPYRVIGIGGIDKVYYGAKLKQANIPINSLQAIDYVYIDWLKKTSNHIEALKGYKGTVNNYFSFNLTSKYINYLNNTKKLDKIINLHNYEIALLNET